MAVLAPQDWQPPRDTSPSQNPRSMEPRNHNHNHRQPSPDVQSPSPQPQPQSHQQQPPNAQQPYPAQPWQPSIQAPPFYPAYPSFFPPQQPLPHQHQHHPHPHAAPSPYFDPNQHFAQWAYQQMVMSAQAQAYHAHQQQQGPHPFSQTQQQQAEYSRSRTNSGGATPPQDFASFQRSASEQQAGSFQPYPRRPSRQGSAASTEPPQPPYARADAAGSSSSIGSGSSGRSRTGSNPAAPQQHLRSTSAGPPSRTTDRDRERERERDRDRRGASSSSERPSEPRRPAKPSPLAQATYPTRGRERERVPSPRPETPTTARSDATTRTSTSTARPEAAAATPAASKRLSISKDDSQIGPSAPAPSGLKGRLRRALSFNATSALENGTDPAEDPARGSRRTALAHASKVNAAATAAAASSPSPTPTSPTSPESPPTPTGPPPPKSRARRAASLFNTKLNASTDNISLSSTVSSASVMIRKLGSMGRLARKNSLMGITGLFKDKDKDKDKSSGAEGSGSGSGSGGRGKGKKSATAAASVTHATAEVDRASGDGPDISGLSPAAKLARQHTLRSNEEAAARQRVATEEARARDAAAAQAQAAGGVGGAPVPVWERGTATRAARRAVLVEDGDGSFEEDDASGSGSDDGSEDGTYDAHRGWDDEEDVTIRVGGVQPQQQAPPPPQDDEETWAVGLRRSVERTRRPAKGILKNATTYDQDAFLDLPPNTTFARVRSNSYNQAPQNHAEPGPLARIPSPDPDHIDGLHPHPPKAVPASDFIPPFTFEDAPRSESPTKTGFFNLTNMNSSAPALSTMQGHVSPPPLAHRAATTPAKRLAFAANLSIYDTFSPLVYDRRSEPATCNRLTPALAQRIKEELNSYKMEEMEVHAASRVHTQFFV